ncbi:Zn-dependent protease [Pullulanibacillus pueri]|uniref:Site-2 protease family protein n=1 Tax=Pullulanibacillus pueri TaxID=1437324 RepID=A0A8J2ZZJ8_9BACL|nr:site-2 protease family protein [Pullulanibacillus pueri]MBM7683814.1 Zn-dependent protease [Pullulanibacillus pueri]GGH87676.1 site-2 protease family protein [Pullulanibacillus pueri]
MAKQKRNNTGKGILAATGLLILSKLKWVFALLKFSKFGGMLISLMVSLGAYALIFGWQFGVALIYLLFVHEMGHLVAAKQKGIKTSPAVFIPFMGAVIGMKEQPKDAATEAYLAYGGPLAGLVSVIPALILYTLTGQSVWALVIMLGSFINLINLFPVSPLDGGRIVGVLSPNLWFLGLLGMIVFTYFYPSVLFVIIIIIGFFSWWRRFREDYNIKVIQLQIVARERLIEKVLKLREDLFYQYYREEDGPMVNQVMKEYLIRDVRQEQGTLQGEISSMSKWLIPILQDRKKLRKMSLILQGQINKELMTIITRIEDQHDISQVVNEQQRIIRKLKGQSEAINKYYNATVRTKVTVFIAYILLAAVLGLLFIYGQGILESQYIVTSLQ